VTEQLPARAWQLLAARGHVTSLCNIPSTLAMAPCTPSACACFSGLTSSSLPPPPHLLFLDPPPLPRWCWRPHCKCQPTMPWPAA
jgi:hypothetical protein